MKSWDKPVIIITGAAGFIGSCLVSYFNQKGIDNLLLVDDIGFSDKWQNLLGKRFLQLLPKKELFQWLQGRVEEVDLFIHLGACSNTMEKDGSYLLENNYNYSIKLAEYALTYQKQFVYASSAATYGKGEQGFLDDEKQLHLLQPLNLYGFSKHLFDQWLVRRGVEKEVVGLKFFNVFGPNEAHKNLMASAITRMVTNICAGKKIQLFRSTLAHLADGEQQRDFIYVKDVVRIIDAFCKQKTGGIFNVGSGQATTWNELAKAVFQALNKEPQIEYIDMPASLVAAYQNYSCADMRKTNAAIGSAAICTNLYTAVDEYVNHYLLPGKKW